MPVSRLRSEKGLRPPSVHHQHAARTPLPPLPARRWDPGLSRGELPVRGWAGLLQGPYVVGQREQNMPA